MHIHDRSSPIELAIPISLRMAVSNGRLFWHAEWYSRHHEDSDDGFFVAWRRKAGGWPFEKGYGMLWLKTIDHQNWRVCPKIFIMNTWWTIFFLAPCPLPLAHSPGNLNAKAVLDESSASMAIQLSGIWASHGCQMKEIHESKTHRIPHSSTLSIIVSDNQYHIHQYW